MDKVTSEGKRINIPRNFSEFAETVKKVGSIDVDLCFQCGKCTSGCPAVFAMDYTPTQLVHAIQLGLMDIVLSSETIWLCASCQTCTTRCPQDVDIARLMDTIKILAYRNKIKAKISEIPAFYKYSLNNIAFFGRMYEIGLIAMLKLDTHQWKKDVAMGLKMFKKGSLNILPSFKGAIAARRIIKKVQARENI